MPTIMTLAAAVLLCATPIDLEIETTRAAIPTLATSVEIDLDSYDIPIIRAVTLADAVRAQGWIHARERFLQMDLARREPAGELGALVPQGTALDRNTIRLGLRHIAERAVAQLSPEHKALLDAYAEGVNAQLAFAKPFEYQLLKAECAPWTPADSMLVQISMARYLDGSESLDRARTPLFHAFGDDVGRFLTSSRGVLDMMVDGSPAPSILPIPTPTALDLRQSRAAPAVPAETKVQTTPGSNAFAVAGSRSRDGRAIVGNDMHLAMMAPNFWYRLDLQWNDGRLVGLSLPGVPALVQGTNGYVAWGFTNLTADLSDAIVVERDPRDDTRYLTASGSKAFDTRVAAIGLGASRTEITVLGTEFGPIVETLPDGRLLALRSPILLDAAIDFGLFDMARARTLEEALDVARTWKGPPQNVLVAAGDGRIGWTISGALPSRARPTSRVIDWREAEPWRGSLAPEAKPVIIDPPSGVLTSGNQLAIAPDGPLAAVLGTDEAPGDRAYRLREILESRDDWNEDALHTVQLDVRSHRLLRWRDALVVALGDAPLSEMAARARDVVANWDGEVTAESSAPVILDAFRREVSQQFGAWLATSEQGARTGLNAQAATRALDDEALLRIVEARPAHLLGRLSNDQEPSPSGAGVAAPDAVDAGNRWREAARAWLERAQSAARAAVARGREPDPAQPFATRGERNRLAMRHPAADALGAAARLAEMPKAALPGHPTCVRVQTPNFGASQRSAVSPAKLEDAVLVTPGGQSGLPTSPHFRSLHSWWQEGKPYPLLSGVPKRRVILGSV
jgi:penicillin G amidase